MKYLLKANNINKTINNKKILTNVNISINEGEIISVVGPSGAGKTTLINILSTLSKPDSTNDCSIYIDNYDILNSNNNNLSKFRNEKLGFIFILISPNLPFAEKTPFSKLHLISLSIFMEFLAILDIKKPHTELHRQHYFFLLVDLT